MSELYSLDPSSPHPCSSERSAAAWLAAVVAQTHGDARPCERTRSSRSPQRQRRSADSAAGQFVDPWRGC